jgi:hypothetical protein
MPRFGAGYWFVMDPAALRRLGTSLRHLVLPIALFLLFLQVFEILLMPYLV